MLMKYKNCFEYAKTLIKWVFFACIVGVIGGIVGSFFHHSIDFVTEFRENHTWILFCLPLGGLVIAVMYDRFNDKGNIDTNRVIQSAREKKDIPFIMLPLIFISSVITHLVGGSAGREGAALQLGGSLGYKISDIFKIDNKDIMVMVGMSAVFSALFGTPFAAAIFAVEVTYLSTRSIIALLPCIISALSGYFISLWLGSEPVKFDIANINIFTLENISKMFVVILICAFVSILFCISLKRTEHIAKKAFKNSYVRGFCGGMIILALTLFLGSDNYNGAGMEVISKALSGKANIEDFILKIIFTSITVAAGFKGGEIVPSFFVGSTLGCVIGQIIGLDPSFCAAVGFIALFCGITKCPIASFALAYEVFGKDMLFVFILTCIITYIFSGKNSIYNDKKSILYNNKGVHD